MSEQVQIDKKIEKKSTKHEKKIPVFRLKPKNRSSECTIKYVGFLEEEDKLGDEIMELDKPIHPNYATVGRHAIPIKQIGVYNMVGRLYRCNIVGSHIAVSNRYPLMYLNVEYERPMVSGSLFQIFFSIDMDKNQKNTIKELKSYVNLKFAGNWVRHIDCDEEFTQNYDAYLQEMLKNEALNMFYRSDDQNVENEKRENMSENEITQWIEKYAIAERMHYDSFMKTQESMEFKSLTKLRDEFVELCMSERFYKFLQLAMKAREQHRRKDYGLEDDVATYVVPKTVTKLDDIRQQMIQDDELILED